MAARSLAPAKWIWFPSVRTLPNTFVLFRKEIHISGGVVSACGWMTADSRYRFTINGERVQWGPAPCDPRTLDVDPVDIKAYLRPGTNVLGAEVLFYGTGDGTWPTGQPGFICRIDILDDVGPWTVASDASWACVVDRAHRPGQHKRCFWRALQEEFDARIHPWGWDAPGYSLDSAWVPALEFPCAPDRPPITGAYPDHFGLGRIARDASALMERDIPLVREEDTPVLRLADAGRVRWLRDPDDWFQFRMPGCMDVTPDAAAARPVPGGWVLDASEGEGVYATFEFEEQVVGWPYFTIQAPAGTVVELICQESHDLSQTHWLDSHLFAWSRFTCTGGVDRFEPFDYESLRWLQLHVNNTSGPVIVQRVGIRRRRFDWPNWPEVDCAEPALARLFSATVNTVVNAAVESIADGGGRERQQYSGDGSHQLTVIRGLFGETRLPGRFLRTFSQGLTPEGYFLDCWPAVDRVVRVGQRQFGATAWGPLLDHSVGFVFDCWHHYWETGDRTALEDPFPRLIKFGRYLAGLVDQHGLLPVTDLGVPTVWMDHNAYTMQRHKQCAFNLYAAAMLTHALAPICRLFEAEGLSAQFVRLGERMLAGTVARFWDTEADLFVANLPWRSEEKSKRLCDRSLANAILFDQCPDQRRRAAAAALESCPPEMGLSYPCNALWRYHALARARRIAPVLSDLRQRWATMPSVVLNNTIQEDWTAPPDTPSDWSHCAVAPLRVALMDLAGIRPSAPGFSAWTAMPQMGDLPDLRVTVRTVRGPIEVRSQVDGNGHRVEITPRLDVDGVLMLAPGSVADLDPTEAVGRDAEGLECFALHAGSVNRFWLAPEFDAFGF